VSYHLCNFSGMDGRDMPGYDDGSESATVQVGIRRQPSIALSKTWASVSARPKAYRQGPGAFPHGRRKSARGSCSVRSAALVLRGATAKPCSFISTRSPPGCPRRAHPRSSRVAWCQATQDSRQHLSPAIAAARVRTQQPRKNMAVHSAELAIEPRLQILRRHRRSLLLCLEYPYRPTVEDHVHCATRLGEHRSSIVRIGISSPG
jgi:hypothetical protein